MKGKPQIANLLIHKPGSLADEAAHLDQLADVYRRGAMIRVRDGAYWYMSAGHVRMRDGAQFCAGFGGRIWFSGGSFGSKYSDQYQGCRIYNKKDRTLSYDNWDPSSYTSWNKRGSC